ncbi:conserved Plasmodium protein, unknown function [Plasmodium sp. DRC-Itaito]|nr:conserved Plasmodium protein, unknown function [Plasmodium sp. DRC-Itaito]
MRGSTINDIAESSLDYKSDYSRDDKNELSSSVKSFSSIDEINNKKRKDSTYNTFDENFFKSHCGVDENTYQESYISDNNQTKNGPSYLVKTKTMQKKDSCEDYKLRSDRVHSSKIDKMNSWKSDKMNSLKSDRLNSLRSDKINSLKSDRLNSLRSDKINSLKSDRLNSLRSDKINSLKSDRLNSLRSDKINSLKSDRLNSLRSDKINSLKSDRLNSLRSDKINSLKSDRLNSLRSDKINSLKSDRLNSVRSDRIRSLKHYKLKKEKRIRDEQMKYIYKSYRSCPLKETEKTGIWIIDTINEALDNLYDMNEKDLYYNNMDIIENELEDKNNKDMDDVKNDSYDDKENIYISCKDINEHIQIKWPDFLKLNNLIYYNHILNIYEGIRNIFNKYEKERKNKINENYNDDDEVEEEEDNDEAKYNEEDIYEDEKDMDDDNHIRRDEKYKHKIRNKYKNIMNHNILKNKSNRLSLPKFPYKDLKDRCISKCYKNLPEIYVMNDENNMSENINKDKNYNEEYNEEFIIQMISLPELVRGLKERYIEFCDIIGDHLEYMEENGMYSFKEYCIEVSKIFTSHIIDLITLSNIPHFVYNLLDNFQACIKNFTLDKINLIDPNKKQDDCNKEGMNNIIIEPYKCDINDDDKNYDKYDHNGLQFENNIIYNDSYDTQIYNNKTEGNYSIHVDLNSNNSTSNLNTTIAINNIDDNYNNNYTNNYNNNNNNVHYNSCNYYSYNENPYNNNKNKTFSLYTNNMFNNNSNNYDYLKNNMQNKENMMTHNNIHSLPKYTRTYTNNRNKIMNTMRSCEHISSKYNDIKNNQHNHNMNILSRRSKTSTMNMPQHTNEDKLNNKEEDYNFEKSSTNNSDININTENNIYMNSSYNVSNQTENYYTANSLPLNNSFHNMETNINQIETNINQIETNINKTETNINQIETNINQIEANNFLECKSKYTSRYHN